MSHELPAASWNVVSGSTGEKTETRFAAVVAALARNPSISHSKAGSRLFGSETLKVHDKIFAMLSSSGNLVVKLPKARVEDLVTAGVGQRFDANQGRPMKEWLEVAPASSQDWLELAREALEFVGT